MLLEHELNVRVHGRHELEEEQLVGLLLNDELPVALSAARCPIRYDSDTMLGCPSFNLIRR